MYHYNPITDTDLFTNMETQYFYDNETDDTLTYLDGMTNYIFWYNPDIELEDGEIIKPINPYKYVVNNIKTLEKWSGKKYSRILFDSERDGIEKETFVNKIKK